MFNPADDEQLINDWRKATGFKKEQLLNQLFTVMAGPIGSAVNSFRGAPLPLPALEMEAKRQALQAFYDWDRSKGMTPASYVTTMVKQRLYRYVGTYQNVARIPEGQLLKIGPLREADTNLTSRFGRPPTTEELADELSMPIKHVERLRRNMRKDLLESVDSGESLEAHDTDPGFEKVMLAYYNLTDQEKLVFDYSLGAHGRPQLKAGDIAIKINASPGRVSQLKTSLANKLKPYLED
jgi:RNA polymerase primary sigma factor